MVVYKDYNQKVRAKCKKFLPLYIKFYIQNICLIRKNRIEVKNNLIIYIDTYQLAKLVANEQCDTTIDISSDSNNESNNDYANIDIAKFNIHIETLLADNVRKSHYKQVVDNYINSQKINIITILITNLRSEIFTYKENPILIHCSQIAKIDDLDKDNINNISQNIIALQKKITHRSRCPPSQKENIDNIGNISLTLY